MGSDGVETGQGLGSWLCRCGGRFPGFLHPCPCWGGHRPGSGGPVGKGRALMPWGADSIPAFRRRVPSTYWW